MLIIYNLYKLVLTRAGHQHKVVQRTCIFTIINFEKRKKSIIYVTTIEFTLEVSKNKVKDKYIFN
jgi:hypothetical protein